jgi:2-iminobutanoate/2-iminopropanoate deaminase
MTDERRAYPVTRDESPPVAADYLVPIPGFTSFTTAQGTGKFVFVSGVTSRGADGEVRAPGDVAGQTDQILRTIRALLADAGGGMHHVRQIRTYVTDIGGWPRIEEIWRRYWPERFPASTLVQVSRLFDVRQLIETDAIAFIPDSVQG